MSENEMNREFDLIVFGASGFTGQFVVEEVVRSAEKEPIKWAISGRSNQKLSEVLAKATEVTGIDVKNVTTIVANVSDEESLRAMTRRTRVVLNTVGPYKLFGEQVVSACVDTATNHLDISGEPDYMESIRLKYNDLAKEKGIFIISACGWDSIPCDLGVQFLKKNFDGELNSVETYFTINASKGFHANIGTWQTIVESMPGALRRRPNPGAHVLARKKYKLKKRLLPHRTTHVNGWCIPFMGSDEEVVQRTQHLKYENFNERPALISTYFNTVTFVRVMGSMLVGIALGTFGWCRCGRSLLERHPKFFTFGFFSKSGPTREELDTISFTMIIVGKGWTEILPNPTDEPKERPNKTVLVKISGHDPAYRATSTCLVQSAYTLLKERDELPKDGGVLTAGAVFDQTDIYERFKQNGLTFEIIEQ